MKNSYKNRPDGYRETIEEGICWIRETSPRLTRGRGLMAARIRRLKKALAEADAVVIGAGAGLSTSAGFTYSGERFKKYFSDFADAFGITDMYSGGFYPFPDPETRWAWWARAIYYNRYVDPSRPVYEKLLALVKDRDYFVITTNVDHQFQRAGIDRARLFYTQGDYGLFQSPDPSDRRTFDNEDWVMRAMEAQGFVRNPAGIWEVPEGGDLSMRLPSGLVPALEDGTPLVMNLRADDTFAEDEGWHRASAAYADFLSSHKGKKVLYLELGVGANTPVIIKYPFWQRTAEEPGAFYACLNYGEAFCPLEIEDRAVCIDGDIGEILDRL